MSPLAAYRESLGLSLRDVANGIEHPISPVTLLRYEGGTAVRYADRLSSDLAAYYGKDPIWIATSRFHEED